MAVTLPVVSPRAAPRPPGSAVSCCRRISRQRRSVRLIPRTAAAAASKSWTADWYAWSSSPSSEPASRTWSLATSLTPQSRYLAFEAQSRGRRAGVHVTGRELLVRERLLDRLRGRGGGRLTGVQGAAGYGKNP